MLIYYQFLLFGFWGYKIMENRNRDTILVLLEYSLEYLGLLFATFLAKGTLFN
jgi:hypothetical protein